MTEQCEKCKHKEILCGGIVGCIFMGADCKKGEKYEPYTNADRIRAMSDEELARFLDDINSQGCVCPTRDCRATCHQCITEWLEEPAEE